MDTVTNRQSGRSGRLPTPAINERSNVNGKNLSSQPPTVPKLTATKKLPQVPSANVVPGTPSKLPSIIPQIKRELPKPSVEEKKKLTQSTEMSQRSSLQLNNKTALTPTPLPNSAVSLNRLTLPLSSPVGTRNISSASLPETPTSQPWLLEMPTLKPALRISEI